MKKIDYFVANPAGNITIFVTSEVDRADYQSVAKKLFAIEEHRAEQVGFIKESSMEMCDLEFCGNASRSYALYKAKKDGLKGEASLKINVSGATSPLQAFVNIDTNYTRVDMPIPERIREWNEGADGLLIDFPGIVHLVLWDKNATRERFDELRHSIEEKYEDVPSAIGVMFYDLENDFMTPIVYVRGVDTTYFEGSCGSGSTAAGIALALKKHKIDIEHVNDDKDDKDINDIKDENIDKIAGNAGALDSLYSKESFLIKQPAGEIITSVEIQNKKIDKVFIEGPVDFGETLSIEI